MLAQTLIFVLVAIASANAGGSPSTSGSSTTSLVNSGDWTGTATFLQNMFSSSSSASSTTMLTLIPTSMQKSCNTNVTSSMTKITMATFESEVIVIIGIIKEFISQLQNANYKCPCIESPTDFYSRVQKGSPNLYNLWMTIYNLFISSWTTFKSKLSGSSLTCVNNSVTTLQSKYTSCWSQTSTAYYALQQTHRDDVASAIVSVSPTIRDMCSLPKVQSYFKVSSNFQASASASASVSGSASASSGISG